MSTIQTVDTPDGPFTLLADDDGSVIASGWTSDEQAILARLRPGDRPAHVTSARGGAAVDAVTAFYAHDFDTVMRVAVRQRGTDMQLRGWRALRGITPGAPLTYTAFATALGSPSAVRAAASICARNAVALFVPCHRVLRGDGTMGGFAWGVDVKRSLLARESS